MYKFYVKMDETTFGPYSAKEILGLGLLDDTLVTEESLNGEWYPARRFDFQDMYLKESRTVINEDGSISRDSVQTRTGDRQGSDTYHTQTGHTPSQDELSKFNWGAFWFSWLWAAFNGIYWPLIFILVNFIPYVGQFAGLGLCIYLGIKGNELAWNAKTWNSWGHFKETQKKWARAFWWIIGICLALVLIGGILASQ